MKLTNPHDKHRNQHPRSVRLMLAGLLPLLTPLALLTLPTTLQAQSSSPTPPLTAIPAPTASPSTTIQYTYDAEGNPTGRLVAPGQPNLGLQTSISYDSLQRPTQITDPGAGTTQLGYARANEHLSSVTDPRRLTTHYDKDGQGQTQLQQSPDSGQSLLRFDAAGNLTQHLDARGALSQYTYDALNRLTSATHSLNAAASVNNTTNPPSAAASVSQSWVYDQRPATGQPFHTHGAGRLTSAVFEGGSHQFAYSPQGQISATQLNLNALTLGVHHQRNAQGQVTRVLYPSARALDITWSQARPSALSFGGQPLIQDLQLDPLGQPQSWNWVMGSGGSAQAPASLVPHQYTRDTQGRLIRQSLGPWLRDLSYDAAGRITGYTHWFNAGAGQGYAQPQYDQQFSYDPLGRLTQVHTAQASWTYQYDANGNRTLVQLTPTATTTTLSSTYTTASDSNRLLATSNPAINLGYDAAGNMQSDGRYLLIHDAAGRLVQVQTTTSAPVLTHTLDNFNLRVKKQAANGSITHFVYDLSPSAGGLPSSYPHLLGEYDATGNPIREYIWLGDTPIAVAVPDTSNGTSNPTTNNPPKLFHIHADHLNTPKVVIEASNGQRRWQWVEDEPFGSIEPQEVVEGARLTLPLRMAGQYADSETGMVYNHHRHYVAGVGRYTQSDPIGLNGGINTYAYVGGDPVNGFDPLGLRRGGNGKGPQKPPTFGFFGCIGLLCVGSQTSDSEAQVGIELTFGGGIEICDPPPPPPPPENTCKRSCGLYDPQCNNQVQPPGIPVPKRFGGLFLGPGFKRDGRFCLRIGPQISSPIPLPSMDLGGISE